jgi:hypothetical protein
MRKAKRYYRCLQFLLPLALVFLSFSGLLPCPPAVAAPLVTLSAPSGPVGLSITINGSVFDSFEGDNIHILFDDIEFDNSPITVPAGGSFSFPAVIPSNAPAGLHHIILKRETADSSVNISVPFTVDERALTVSVSEGHVGDKINIQGSGFYVGQAVMISYYNPGAGTIGTVTASAAGTFNLSYTIPAGLGGAHKITASNDAGNTAETSFKIIPWVVLSVSSASPGEWLRITGSGFGDTKTVTITFDSHNVASSTTGNSGGFEVEFPIPVLPLANYTLKAQDASGNSASLLFAVTAGAVFSELAGSVGDTVTVTGDGFKPNAPVSIYYDEQDVATKQTDATGDFKIGFTVPPSKGGAHTIAVSDGAITRRYDFSVETQAPAAPVLLMPEHNGMSGAYAHFTWQKVIDSSVPVTYKLEIAANLDFTGIVFTRDGITDNQYTLGTGEALAASAADPVYFWRLSATDGAGNLSAWSEIHSFYVDFPSAPSLQASAGGEALKLPVNLSWQAITDSSLPITYSLQISRNSEFTALLVDDKGLASPSYAVSKDSKRIFTAKYTYYWRVKAIDNAGNASGWSSAGSFSIAPNGFPAWAAWALGIAGFLIVGLLIFRILRKKAYHQAASNVI